MTTEEEFEIYKRGVEQGRAHSSTSPETDKRLALQEQRFDNMNTTLEEIKRSIDSTKRWIIGFLFGLIGTTLYFGFTVGSWKGNIEGRLSNVELILQKHIDTQK